MPLVICVVLFFLEQQIGTVGGTCSSAKDVAKQSSNFPTVEMSNLEFPNEHVLPTGYNITVVCTSNKPADKNEKNYKPFWIRYTFNNVYQRDLSCGGGYQDSHYENTKVCYYFIQNATEKNSGNYTCIANNNHGCTIETMTLKFKEPTPPTLTSNPTQDVDVYYGSTTNLTCEARGFPKPTVTWFKDGRPLFGGNIRDVQGASQLTLESVTTHDRGVYWCEANNSEGWKRSVNTAIKVLSMPTILVHPSNVFLDLEEKTVKAIFSCKASGIPRPSISWLKNNSTLTGGIVIQNGSSSILLIERVTREENFARFKCIAKNPFGEVSSQEGVLVVREWTQHSGIPEGERSFYLQPKSVKAIAGDSIVFVCAMEGSPVPRIMWLKDGTANVDGSIDYHSGRQSATSVLKIYPVSERHVGRYSCEVTRLGVITISQEAVLAITEKESSRSSLCISKAVLIPVATGAALLSIIIISVFYVHHRNKNAKFNVEKKMRENNQFLHLHTGGDVISQQRGDITVP